MSLSEDCMIVDGRFESVDRISRRISEDLVVSHVEEPIQDQAEDAPVDAPKSKVDGLRRKSTQLFSFGKSRRRNWLQAITQTMPKKQRADLSQTPMAIASVVVVAGPGRGQGFFLTRPVSRIGRGDAQDIALNFGDQSISRTGHATIYYDDESNSFAVEDGNKPNPIMINNRVLDGVDVLRTGDYVTVGETVLRFTAICDDEFVWQKDAADQFA